MFSLILLVVVTGLWLVQTAVSRMAAVVIGAAFWSVVAVVARVLGALLEGESRLGSVELTIVGSDAVVGTAPFDGDDSMDIEASDALLALGIPVYGDDDEEEDDDSTSALGMLLIPTIIITPPEEDDLADDSIDSICESALAFTDSHQTTIFTQPDEAAMDLDDDDDDSNTSVDSAYGHIQNHLEERTRGIVTEFYELPPHEREFLVDEEQGEQVSQTSPSLVSQDATVVSARPDEAIEPEVVAEPAQASGSVHTPPHKQEDPEEYQSVDSGSPASTPTLVHEDASVGSSPTSSTTALSVDTMASADSPSDDGEKLVKVDAPVGRCPCSSVPRVRWIELLNAKPELTFFTTCSHRPSVGDVVKKPGVVKRTKTALKKVLRRRKGGET
ncbi:hypothetical protein MKEN_00651800 [Mycena kentingensis (nom. inval.)]|nr:hypothetical protein MKEN_00651800 [Mycena kentingensis (nom. inval.)]